MGNPATGGGNTSIFGLSPEQEQSIFGVAPTLPIPITTPEPTLPDEGLISSIINNPEPIAPAPAPVAPAPITTPTVPTPAPTAPTTPTAPVTSPTTPAPVNTGRYFPGGNPISGGGGGMVGRPVSPPGSPAFGRVPPPLGRHQKLLEPYKEHTGAFKPPTPTPTIGTAQPGLIPGIIKPTPTTGWSPQWGAEMPAGKRSQIIPGPVSGVIGAPAASPTPTPVTKKPVAKKRVAKPKGNRPAEADPYERWKQLGRPGGNFDTWKAGQ